ncbi:prenyltransferase and squalene oxidase [Xylariales sp. AK1849]|nr:prenyltransferase and squalene oxidase [Xylariales sp. AK1849]
MELDTARHIRYWQRCYKSLLPHHYTPNDSNRLALGYFILAALDLLSSPSSPPSLIPPTDRARLRAWVLSLQHRSGGFCGSPHHVLPELFTRGYGGELRLPTPNNPENANIAATYFALLLLGILADDSEKDAQETYRDVDREATLRWMQRLQRPDGSFGEIVKEDGTIGGGRDMRYCHMASTIRWILRGNEGAESLDFNIDGFVAHIRGSQAFDGGLGEASVGESHAGYAYCAVAALSNLDIAAQDRERPNRYLKAGIPDMEALLHWLVCRQFAYLGHTEEDDEESTSAPPDGDFSMPDVATLSIKDFALTGFSGRLNKVADTCYAWWVTGTLRILIPALPQSAITCIDRASGRAFLLEKTQHVIGGFGKHVEGPPDIYHSYLGLAALATMADEEGEAGLGKLDVRLVVGREAAGRIARGREFVAVRRDIEDEHEDEDQD